MNAKAKELGLTHTSFENPHGLDEPGHYTSARDIEVLARYAMANPEFRRIVGDQVHPDRRERSDRVHNSNLLIGSYTGATGVKTGWTDGAGYSVAASAKRGDGELYAVVLGTPSEQARFREAAAARLGLRALPPPAARDRGHDRREGAGQRLPRRHRARCRLRGRLGERASTCRARSNGTVHRRRRSRAPVEAGQRVGSVVFTQAGRYRYGAAGRHGAVRAPTLLERVGIGIARAWRASVRLTARTLAAAMW